MKKYFLIIFLLFSGHASACGSTAMIFSSYLQQCESLECKNNFLKQQQCSTLFNYLPLDADPIIVSVLLDAIGNGVEKVEIVKTFDRYNCAFTARNLEGYKKIEAFMGKASYEKYCSQERLDSLYLISTRLGVILRSGPSIDSQRIGTVAKGRFVEEINGSSGHWIHVKTYAGDGFIHKKLLTPYRDAISSPSF